MMSPYFANICRIFGYILCFSSTYFILWQQFYISLDFVMSTMLLLFLCLFFFLVFFLILFLASFECLVAALKVSLWPTAWSVYCLPAWPCSRRNEPCAKRQPQSSHRKCFEVHRYVVWCDVVCCVLTYAIVAVDIGFCNNFVAHHFRKRNTHTSHILIVWLSVLGVCMSHFNSCILWRAF